MAKRAIRKTKRTKPFPKGGSRKATKLAVVSDRLTGRELVIMRGAGVVQPGEEAIAVPTRLPEVP